MTDEQKAPAVTTVIETIPSTSPPGSMRTKVTVTQSSTTIEEFGRWSAGLVSGFIRGGAHAITSGTAIQVIDPGSQSQAMARYGILFILHGILSTAMYLQSHPIPDEWDSSKDPDRRNGNGHRSQNGDKGE